MVGTPPVQFANPEQRITPTGANNIVPTTNFQTNNQAPVFKINFAGSTPQFNFDNPSTATQNWQTQGANTVSNVNAGTNDSNQTFLKNLNDYYEAARAAGYTYQRTDPSNTNGMDCCTGPWGFLMAYLSPEDRAKLEPLKPQAYNMKDADLTHDQRVRGFAGAIGDAGLGATEKVDKAFVDNLKGKSDAEIKEKLIGRMVTITGTNGDHVYTISDAWKDTSTGEIKYKMLGPNLKGKAIEEGGSSGIGTASKVYSLADDIKPGANMHIVTFNADVIARANQNASGQDILAKVKGGNSAIA